MSGYHRDYRESREPSLLTSDRQAGEQSDSRTGWYYILTWMKWVAYKMYCICAIFILCCLLSGCVNLRHPMWFLIQCVGLERYHWRWDMTLSPNSDHGISCMREYCTCCSTVSWPHVFILCHGFNTSNSKSLHFTKLFNCNTLTSSWRKCHDEAHQIHWTTHFRVK